MGNRSDNFKATLDSIAIYADATYCHGAGMMLKALKEVVIPQIYNPEDDTSDSSKYFWKLG